MKKKNVSNGLKVVIGIIIALASVFGYVTLNEDGSFHLHLDNDISYQAVKDVDGELEVHFIDVGQADSILIEQGEYSMLIDAGTNSAAQTVVDYLEDQDISELEYVIGTHPHEDHIGGMDNVISNFSINTLLFPKVTATTKTYEDVISAAQTKNLKLTVPQVGKTYTLGEASFEILAPNSSSYSSTNDYSIVIKLTYGENTFLFTGDAEELSEEEMLDKNFDLSADLLKVGHHGSDTSTSQAFLNAVNPQYAVISVGVDNKYGHPKKSTMDLLKEKGIEVYRTDEQGTIIAVSDGKNITFNQSPASYRYMSE